MFELPQILITKGYYLIERSPVLQTILSITGGDRTVRLNDAVISNGKGELAAGVKGRVVEINEPFTPEHPNEAVILVITEGGVFNVSIDYLHFETAETNGTAME